MTTDDPTPENPAADALDTIEFTTPAARQREDVTTPVNLCGEDMVVRRPKDATLFFAQSAVADSANDADRMLAILQLIDASLEASDRYRLLERACDGDDDLTAGAVYDMFEELFKRWGEDSKVPAAAPVRVEAVPDSIPAGAPARIVNHDLGLDLVCHPPKDIILHITASSIAAGTNRGQQAWCLMLFLDAALTKADSMVLDQRMRNTRDPLDLEALLAIVEALVGRWYPDEAVPAGGNRKQRRAAAAGGRKKPKNGGGTKKAAATRVKEPELFSEDEDG